MTPINPYAKIAEARNAAVKSAMPDRWTHKTWQEWDAEKIDGVSILDPDGFRHDDPNATAFYSRDEFLNRRIRCTVNTLLPYATSKTITLTDGHYIHNGNGFYKVCDTCGREQCDCSTAPKELTGVCENCHTVLHDGHIICTDCAAKILDAVMTEPPSETPRTDKRVDELFQPSGGAVIVDAKFAEGLEKELAAANTKIKGLEDQVTRERDDWGSLETIRHLEQRHTAMVTHEKELREKCESLEQWKKQASTVLDRIKLEEVAKEIEVPLGKDIPPAILPWILEAKLCRSESERQYQEKVSEIHGLTAKIEELEAKCENLLCAQKYLMADNVAARMALLDNGFHLDGEQWKKETP